MSKAKIHAFLQNDSEERKTSMVLLASNAATFDPDKYRKLKEMGLTNSANFLKENEVKGKLDDLNDILEIDDFVKGTKRSLGEVEIIEYSKLLQFCKKNNLLFGKAALYKGNIPQGILEEVLDFNFDRVKNFATINTLNTIIKSADNNGDPAVYVATSPHHFNGSKAFISNKEVIASKSHRKLKNLSKNSYKDSLILSPLKFKKKIYFIIIKVW